MRRPFLIAGSSVILAAAMACANAGDEPTAAPPPQTGGAVPADGSVAQPPPAEDAAVDVAPSTPTCSTAGWCTTSLPDVDLVLRDVRPWATSAFAVAESITLGVKLLAWDDAAQSWKYIDDNSQNEAGLGPWVGKTWSPSEDEIYYTIAPSTVYHGKRNAAPAAGWSWTHASLADNSPDDNPTHDHGHPRYSQLKAEYPALGVWGTSANDVYAWYANTIYHWDSDSWVAEYIADDVDVDVDQPAREHLFFLGAAGTSSDDLWFAGARDASPSYGGVCPILVHKTSAGYQRIADGITGYACSAREGFLKIDGLDGWVTDLQMGSGGELIGLRSTTDILRLTVEGETYAMTLSTIPFNVGSASWGSLWNAPEEKVWLTGSKLVATGADIWDGGTYRVSTISLTGAPLDRPMYQVRGTSNTNLWSVGVGHALHKTTP